MAAGSLALAGVSSLKALNTWISVIDGNIAGTQKTAYKETRISLSTDLETDTTYKTYKGYSITLPSSTLLVSNTQILSYEQGTLADSDDLGHLALNGRGYFVVENEKGQRFATRDGEFHFDNSGFLVTAQGLKVLSAAQDYINIPTSDVFSLRANGTTSGLDSYGEHELMIVDLPQSNHLRYSQYGSTVFDIGNYVPINFTSDFSKTMDGINPYLVNKSYQKNYVQDEANSRITIDTTTDTNALISSHRFTDFNNYARFQASTAASGSGFSSFGFTFGQSDMTNDISDGGFGAGVYQTSTGQYKLGIFEGTASGSILDEVNIPNLDPSKQYDLSLKTNNGVATVTLSETVGGASYNVSFDIPKGAYENTYVSLGTFDRATLDSITGLTTATGGTVELTELKIRESNKTNYSNILITGGTADSLGTEVCQRYLEKSTSSLSDSIPLLGQVQKVFSALSKIISVSNSQTDELNGLIR